MSEVTIPGLSTQLTSVDRAADLLEVSDTSDSGNSKKSSVNNLLDLTSHPVGLDEVQTLTNKTITAPTISSPVLSGSVTGTYTLAGTPTFPSSVVTLTGSQTLTNKVLTSPTINTATINNPTLTVDSIAEFTVANGITIDGLNIKDSKLNTNNSVVTTNITDANVTAPKMANTGTWDSTWAWQTWTPTLTNLSGGTQTYAKYTQIGKTVYFRFKYVLAGAGVAGEIAFTPPVTLNAQYVAESYLNAQATFYDLSVVTGYTGNVRVASTTSLTIRCIHTDGTRATNQAASSTNPFVFATGDIIEAHGSYEA